MNVTIAMTLAKIGRSMKQRKIVDDEDVPTALVGRDRDVGHEDRLAAGERQADAREEARQQDAIRIRKHGSHLDRPGRRIDAVAREVDLTDVRVALLDGEPEVR